MNLFQVLLNPVREEHETADRGVFRETSVC
jgi:hypothetical protein